MALFWMTFALEQGDLAYPFLDFDRYSMSDECALAIRSGDAPVARNEASQIHGRWDLDHVPHQDLPDWAFTGNGAPICSDRLWTALSDRFLDAEWLPFKTSPSEGAQGRQWGIVDRKSVV